MSRPVVAMVSPRALDGCRSSVSSVRGDMSFLHFMSVSLNDSCHLCTCKFGHFFPFLPLLVLGQRRKEGSLLSAVCLPIAFLTNHFIL